MLGDAGGEPEERDLTLIEENLADHFLVSLWLPFFRETWPGASSGVLATSAAQGASASQPSVRPHRRIDDAGLENQRGMGRIDGPLVFSEEGVA